ncbi:hypothetical protein I79_002487 [Cricetulus griseus]|uniref:Uncharacterized protein n=1 Tax=Cricetulus griseus TaxID=10029 RepID=G3GXJ6_CRIGR|nr:hypothetical protein I79_002487 [Cricetulus griseus]
MGRSEGTWAGSVCSSLCVWVREKTLMARVTQQDSLSTEYLCFFVGGVHLILSFRNSRDVKA